jgi:hypothetical protein
MTGIFYAQVHKTEAKLRHKQFPPNSWMKVLHFNVLTSCPKDELNQWFIRLYSEHIIPAIVYRYTKVLQRPDLITVADFDNASAISDPDSVWIVRPQLFFQCTVRPLNATKGGCNSYSDEITLDLVFFSAFEDLHPQTSGTIESNGIRKLY